MLYCHGDPIGNYMVTQGALPDSRGNVAMLPGENEMPTTRVNLLEKAPRVKRTCGIWQDCSSHLQKEQLTQEEVMTTRVIILLFLKLHVYKKTSSHIFHKYQGLLPYT